MTAEIAKIAKNAKPPAMTAALAARWRGARTLRIISIRAPE
jgi:hypothetical protein